MRNEENKWVKKAAVFLFSQTLSLFGTSLVQYAILWYVTLKTQSGVMMMISVVVGFLPNFLMAPFAGVWADRYDRKKLIAYSDSGIALVTLGVIGAYWSGYDSLWLLFGILAVRAFGSSIQSPAVGAFIPQFVPESQLMRINGIQGSLQSIVMLISPMLSGFLMTFASFTNILMIDVVTAALAVSILLFLKVPPHKGALTKKESHFFGDFKEGIRYIVSHPYLSRFFLFTALFQIFINPAAMLTPLQTTRSYGAEVWRLSAIEVAFSSGMLLGGILLTSWGGFKNRVKSMALATFFLGILTIALGIVNIFWIYLSVMALIGLIIPLYNTPATVLLQEKVDPDYMGRVFGVLGMIYGGMMPLGMVVFGPLADMMKIEALLLISGVVIVLLGVGLARNKLLIKAGEKTPTVES